jgi:hypothetical protein
MNAQIKHIDHKKLTRQKLSEITINSEVIFFKNKKPYRGIIISADYDYFTAVVAFLDEFGKFKIVKDDFRSFFIYPAR